MVRFLSHAFIHSCPVCLARAHPPSPPPPFSQLPPLSHCLPHLTLARIAHPLLTPFLSWGTCADPRIFVSLEPISAFLPTAHRTLPSPVCAHPLLAPFLEDLCGSSQFTFLIRGALLHPFCIQWAVGACFCPSPAACFCACPAAGQRATAAGRFRQFRPTLVRVAVPARICGTRSSCAFPHPLVIRASIRRAAGDPILTHTAALCCGFALFFRLCPRCCPSPRSLPARRRCAHVPAVLPRQQAEEPSQLVSIPSSPIPYHFARRQAMQCSQG